MPSEEDIQETRFARLDRVIARDIERRRRSLKLYWALLVGAFLLAVRGLVWVPSAEDVAKQTAAEFADGDEFGELVQDAVGEGVRERFADVDAELEAFRRALTQMEKTQAGLARRLERQLVVTEELSAQLGEVSSQLEEVGAELEKLRKNLGQLSERRQRSQLMPTSFLLKENRNNPLHELEISIRLGPRDDDGVEAVTVWEGISEESVQLYPTGDDSASGAELDFGQFFEFRDGKNNRYCAKLTSAQHRLWAKDFVGLEVAEPAPGAAPGSCEPSP